MVVVPPIFLSTMSVSVSRTGRHVTPLPALSWPSPGPLLLFSWRRFIPSIGSRGPMRTTLPTTPIDPRTPCSICCSKTRYTSVSSLSNDVAVAFATLDVGLRGGDYYPVSF